MIRIIKNTEKNKALEKTALLFLWRRPAHQEVVLQNRSMRPLLLLRVESPHSLEEQSVCMFVFSSYEGSHIVG